MSADQQTLQLLASHLDNTLSTDTATRNKATDEIRALESRPGSSLLLLHLLASSSAFSAQTRQAAAIAFKNFIMTHWDDEPDPSSLLPPQDRATIKQHLVSLMLNSPPSIQQQLSQVLAIISKSDFPSQWESLLPDLTATLLSPSASHATVMGCLSTLHSIFFRYRHEYRSNALFIEIKYVLGLFAQPLTSLFSSTAAAILASPPSSPALPEAFSRLHLQLELFLSLNSQDIPEFFEDHMADWFRPFQQLLPFASPAAGGGGGDASDDAEESVVDRCKSLVCEIVNLYAMRYEEQFSSWVSSFVELVWQLLSRLSSSPQYDHLVSTSIRFLTSVSSKPFNKHLFSSPAALSTITQQIIIPQIKLRPSDVAIFHGDPAEWVRRDIEGSDVDTRRRVTVDLIRGLLVSFESELTELMKGYTAQLIASYADSRGERWLDKDAAIYIILALSSKGVTRSRGITKTNPYIDLSSFFSTQILAELQQPGGAGAGREGAALSQQHQPILQADSIRFIAAFRSQLNAQQLLTILPLLITHITSPHYVVHTYAAYAVERILTVRNDSGAPVISQADFFPFAQAALVALFRTMSEHEESRENEYLMRCVLRVVSLHQKDVIAIVGLLIDKLTAIVLAVSQNPTHPNFNHAVFDTYAAVIVNVCNASPASVNEFEAALFPLFQSILTSETAADFSPYIFQILSLLLERRPDVSPQYRAVYPSLLYPALYENTGNIPALVRLLSAYLSKHKASPASPVERLPQVLGIFQKLLSNRRQHLLAVDLLLSIVDCLQWAELEPFTLELMRLLFIKFQSKPGSLFLGRIVVFFSVFVLRHGGSRLVQSMDAVQPAVSLMVVEKIVIANLSAVVAPHERLTVAVGLTDLLTSGALLSGDGLQAVPRLVLELVRFVSSNSVIITEVDAEGDEDDDAAAASAGVTGDQSVFCRLAHATALPVSYTPVVDAKQYLAAGLRQIGGKLGGLHAVLNQITDATDKLLVEDFLLSYTAG